MSDYMDRTLDLGYVWGTAILTSLLLMIFGIWRLSGASLSVKDIRSRKVEIMYWVAILFSNTLGTALGDFLAHSSGLGFMGGAALIGGLLALVVLGYFLTPLSRVLLFWLAFVLTRPFGATLGDVLTKPHDEGGLNFGTIGSSVVLASILVIVVAYTSIMQRRAAPTTGATLAPPA
jgi:uncharacterized membrane-anchored protein